jgi:hypothetical protein
LWDAAARHSTRRSRTLAIHGPELVHAAVGQAGFGLQPVAGAQDLRRRDCL